MNSKSAERTGYESLSLCCCFTTVFWAFHATNQWAQRSAAISHDMPWSVSGMLKNAKCSVINHSASKIWKNSVKAKRDAVMIIHGYSHWCDNCTSNGHCQNPTKPQLHSHELPVKSWWRQSDRFPLAFLKHHFISKTKQTKTQLCFHKDFKSKAVEVWFFPIRPYGR